MKGINLRERRTEIKFLIERELRLLTSPCSLSDMVKRVGASRMPVMKHLESLLSTPEFSDLSMVRLGGVDVIYRTVTARIQTVKTEVEKYATDNGNTGSSEGTGNLGRSGQEGQAGQ